MRCRSILFLGICLVLLSNCAGKKPGGGGDGDGPPPGRKCNPKQRGPNDVDQADNVVVPPGASTDGSGSIGVSPGLESQSDAPVPGLQQVSNPVVRRVVPVPGGEFRGIFDIAEHPSTWGVGTVQDTTLGRREGSRGPASH